MFYERRCALKTMTVNFLILGIMHVVYSIAEIFPCNYSDFSSLFLITMSTLNAILYLGQSNSYLLVVVLMYATLLF